jgi:hypothetical protein
MPRQTARRVEEHAMETLLTKSEALGIFKVRKSKFAEDIQPRLETIYVGPRSPRFTRSSAERLMEALKAESAAVAAAKPPVPVNPKRKAPRRAAEDA